MVGLSLWNMPLNNVEDALLPGMTWRQRATTVAMGPEMIPVMAMVSQTFPWPGKRGARANESTAAAVEAAAHVEVTMARDDSWRVSARNKYWRIRMLSRYAASSVPVSAP